MVGDAGAFSHVWLAIGATAFATDFTSVGPRLLHYGTGPQCGVVQNPLNPRRKVGGEKSKVSAIGGRLRSSFILSRLLLSILIYASE